MRSSRSLFFPPRSPEGLANRYRRPPFVVPFFSDLRTCLPFFSRDARSSLVTGDRPENLFLFEFPFPPPPPASHRLQPLSLSLSRRFPQGGRTCSLFFFPSPPFPLQFRCTLPPPPPLGGTSPLLFFFFWKLPPEFLPYLFLSSRRICRRFPFSSRTHGVLFPEKWPASERTGFHPRLLLLLFYFWFARTPWESESFPSPPFPRATIINCSSVPSSFPVSFLVPTRFAVSRPPPFFPSDQKREVPFFSDG